MLGLNPFDIAGRSPWQQQRATRRPPDTPGAQPIVTTATEDGAYCISLSAPAGHSLANPRASPLDEHSILLEGELTPTMPGSGCEYVARVRSGVYSAPSRSSLIGFVPPGTVIRGSAPSSQGWITLEDDEESYVLDDGSLALRNRNRNPPSSFAKKIELPRDADLERATTISGGRNQLDPDEPSLYKVVFRQGPRVAIRSKAHPNAPILGALAVGDVVEGIVDEFDPSWLRLTNHSRTGYVMIAHPHFGRLLAPVQSSRQRPVGNNTIYINVPRRTAKPAAKRPAASLATSPPSATQGRRPAPAAATPNAAKAPPARATVAPTPPRGVATRSPDDATSAASAKKHKQAETRRSVAASMHEVLGVDVNAVLCECAASPQNVQSPTEAVEAWVAVDDGGFAPLAMA